MELSGPQKALLILGCMAGVSPLVVWGVSTGTVAAAFAAIVLFGVPAGLIFGRARRA